MIWIIISNTHYSSKVVSWIEINCLVICACYEVTGWRRRVKIKLNHKLFQSSFLLTKIKICFINNKKNYQKKWQCQIVWRDGRPKDLHAVVWMKVWANCREACAITSPTSTSSTQWPSKSNTGFSSGATQWGRRLMSVKEIHDKEEELWGTKSRQFKVSERQELR